MGWLNLSSLRNLFANRSTTRLLGMTERQFQEWVDLHRLYLALAYYDERDDVHAEEDPTETLTEEAASKSIEVGGDDVYIFFVSLLLQSLRGCETVCRSSGAL